MTRGVLAGGVVRRVLLRIAVPVRACVLPLDEQNENRRRREKILLSRMGRLTSRD